MWDFIQELHRREANVKQALELSLGKEIINVHGDTARKRASADDDKLVVDKRFYAVDGIEARMLYQFSIFLNYNTAEYTFNVFVDEAETIKSIVQEVTDWLTHCIRDGKIVDSST